MKVEFSPSVEGDLAAVADYIAQDNPRRALTFVFEIYDEIKAIGRNPLHYRLQRKCNFQHRLRLQERRMFSMRVPASVAVTKASLLLAMLVSCSGGPSRSQATVDQGATRASICSIMASPKAYGGTTVEVVGRVTATKEGIDIWDPSCRGVGIDLSIDFDVHADNGFGPLEAALKAHGLSDYPVIATIQGSFMPDRYDEIRRRKRTVIVVQKVTDVHQSSEQEHR